MSDVPPHSSGKTHLHDVLSLKPVGFFSQMLTIGVEHCSQASNGASRDGAGAFATSALELAAAGFAIVPADQIAKKPLPRWGRIKKAPTALAINRWLERPDYSAANVGALCDLSRIAVIDIDSPDPALHAFARERFGNTVLEQQTPSGGRHLFYRAQAERTVIRIDHMPIDLKAGRAFVVLAPSKRPDGRSYEWLLPPGTTLAEAMRSLPPIIDKSLGITSAGNAASGPLSDVQIGNRNRALFTNALKLALKLETIGELEQSLLVLNEGIQAGDLPQHEVARIARSAWAYELGGKNWAGRGDPANQAIDLFKDASSDALKLFLVLRRAHKDRRSAFAISPAGMARGEVIGRWNKQKFRRARNELLLMNVVAKIHESTGKGDPDLFEFGAAARF